MRVRTASAACRSVKPSRELQDRNQRQPYGAKRRLAVVGKKAAKLTIFKKGGEGIKETHVEIAFGKDGACNAGGLFGNSPQSSRFE